MPFNVDLTTQKSNIKSMTVCFLFQNIPAMQAFRVVYHGISCVSLVFSSLDYMY